MTSTSKVFGPVVPVHLRQQPDKRPKRVHYTTDPARAVGFAGWAFQCDEFTSDPHPSQTHAVKAKAKALQFGKCHLDHRIVRLYFARSGGRRPASEGNPYGFPEGLEVEAVSAPVEFVELTDEEAADAWCTAVELLGDVDDAAVDVASLLP